MLGYVPWWIQTLAVLFFVVCVFLVIIVLLQKGKGGGLSAAFGGAGGQSAFGSKTGDVFTWVTVVTVVIFFVLAGVLTIKYHPYDEFESELPGLTASPSEQSPPDAETTTEGAEADQPGAEKPTATEGAPKAEKPVAAEGAATTEKPTAPEDKPAAEKPVAAEKTTETPVEEKKE